MGLSHPQCQETSLAHWTTATLKFKDKSLKYDKGNFIAVLKLSADTLHEYHGEKIIYTKCLNM